MFIWYLLAALPTSQLMRHYSNKILILFGLSFMTLGVIVLIYSRNFAQALFTFSLFGLGNVILQVIFNPLLSFIAPSPRDGTSFMILRQITEAITAILLPFFLIWSQRRFGHWQTILYLTLAFAIVALIWIAFSKIPQQPVQKRITWPIIKKILTTPGVILFLLGIVTIGGFNNSLMTIVPRFLMERTHLDFTTANLSNTVFFGCRLVGEIVGAILLLRLNPWRFFRFMSICGVLILAALLLSRQAWLIFLLVGAAGFVYSSLTSLIFTQVLNKAPGQSAAASGLVITSWAGASFFSLITGIITKFADNQGSGIVFFLLCALVVYFLSYRFSRLANSPSSLPTPSLSPSPSPSSSST